MESLPTAVFAFKERGMNAHTGSASEADGRLITAQDFYHIHRLEDPRLSPDGSRVAFVWRTVDKAENTYRCAIWVAPVDTGPGKQFTAGEKQDISPRWSPDGRRLAFVSNRREDKNQIYLIDLDGGEARRLTDMENGASDPVWSADGQRIAFVSSVSAEERAEEDKSGTEKDLDADERRRRAEEKERAREKKFDPRVVTRLPFRTGTDYLGDRYRHFYIIDANAKDAKPQRVTDGDFDFAQPSWLADGSALIAWALRDPEAHDPRFFGEVLRIPIAGGEPAVLSKPGYHPMQPLPSPDGQWVAYLRIPDKVAYSQVTRLVVVPASGGGTVELTADLDASVNDFCWASNSQWLYFTAGVRGNNGLYRVLATGGPAEQILSGVRYVTGFDAINDRLVYVQSEPDNPSDLFVSDASGQSERRLTEINAKFLAAKETASTEEIWYESHDGTQIQGWIVKPPNFDPAEKYPLVLEIHGGPHAMWGSAEPTMWHEFQVLAARGYFVFYCNPRGSGGYGQDFRLAIHANWGFADYRDYLAGVDCVVARGYVDADRLAITGGSYGGYMTAWMIGQDDRFKAAASQRGVYDLGSFTGTTDIPRFTEHQFDTFYWENPQKLWEHSPLAHVAKIQTPLLIIHSEQDFRAPISGAEQLYAALRRLGRTVSFVRYPREGHELSRSGKPKHRIDRLNRIVDWFDRYAKGEAD
jgi:dipeptidyl aminopeptidase/acylaminoacyl peptidase